MAPSQNSDLRHFIYYHISQEIFKAVPVTKFLDIHDEEIEKSTHESGNCLDIEDAEEI